MYPSTWIGLAFSKKCRLRPSPPRTVGIVIDIAAQKPVKRVESMGVRAELGLVAQVPLADRAPCRSHDFSYSRGSVRPVAGRPLIERAAFLVLEGTFELGNVEDSVR